MQSKDKTSKQNTQSLHLFIDVSQPTQLTNKSDTATEKINVKKDAKKNIGDLSHAKLKSHISKSNENIAYISKDKQQDTQKTKDFTEPHSVTKMPKIITKSEETISSNSNAKHANSIDMKKLDAGNISKSLENVSLIMNDEMSDTGDDYIASRLTQKALDCKTKSTHVLCAKNEEISDTQETQDYSASQFTQEKSHNKAKSTEHVLCPEKEVSDTQETQDCSASQFTQEKSHNKGKSTEHVLCPEKEVSDTQETHDFNSSQTINEKSSILAKSTEHDSCLKNKEVSDTQESHILTKPTENILFTENERISSTQETEDPYSLQLKEDVLHIIEKLKEDISYHKEEIKQDPQIKKCDILNNTYKSQNVHPVTTDNTVNETFGPNAIKVTNDNIGLPAVNTVRKCEPKCGENNDQVTDKLLEFQEEKKDRKSHANNEILNYSQMYSEGTEELSIVDEDLTLSQHVKTPQSKKDERKEDLQVSQTLYDQKKYDIDYQDDNKSTKSTEVDGDISQDDKVRTDKKSTLSSQGSGNLSLHQSQVSNIGEGKSSQNYPHNKNVDKSMQQEVDECGDVCIDCEVNDKSKETESENLSKDVSSSTKPVCNVKCTAPNIQNKIDREAQMLDSSFHIDILDDDATADLLKSEVVNETNLQKNNDSQNISHDKGGQKLTNKEFKIHEDCVIDLNEPSFLVHEEISNERKAQNENDDILIEASNHTNNTPFKETSQTQNGLDKADCSTNSLNDLNKPLPRHSRQPNISYSKPVANRAPTKLEKASPFNSGDTCTVSTYTGKPSQSHLGAPTDIASQMNLCDTSTARANVDKLSQIDPYNDGDDDDDIDDDDVEDCDENSSNINCTFHESVLKCILLPSSILKAIALLHLKDEDKVMWELLCQNKSSNDTLENEFIKRMCYARIFNEILNMKDKEVNQLFDDLFLNTKDTISSILNEINNIKTIILPMYQNLYKKYINTKHEKIEEFNIFLFVFTVVFKCQKYNDLHENYYGSDFPQLFDSVTNMITNLECKITDRFKTLHKLPLPNEFYWFEKAIDLLSALNVKQSLHFCLTNNLMTNVSIENEEIYTLKCMAHVIIKRNIFSGKDLTDLKTKMSKMICKSNDIYFSDNIAPHLYRTKEKMVTKDPGQLKRYVIHSNILSDKPLSKTHQMPRIWELNNLLNVNNWQENMDESRMSQNIESMLSATKDFIIWYRRYDKKDMTNDEKKCLLRSKTMTECCNDILGDIMIISSPFEVMKPFHVSPVIVYQNVSEAEDMYFQAKEVSKACILLIMLSMVKRIVFVLPKECNGNTVIVTSGAKDHYNTKQNDMNIIFNTGDTSVLSSQVLDSVLKCMKRKESIKL